MRVLTRVYIVEKAMQKDMHMTPGVFDLGDKALGLIGSLLFAREGKDYFNEFLTICD